MSAPAHEVIEVTRTLHAQHGAERQDTVRTRHFGQFWILP